MKKLIIAAIMFLSMPAMAAVNLSPHIDIGISGIMVLPGTAGGVSIGMTMFESDDWKFIRVAAATTFIHTDWIEIQPVGYGYGPITAWVGAGVLMRAEYMDEYRICHRWGVTGTVAVRLK